MNGNKSDEKMDTSDTDDAKVDIDAFTKDGFRAAAAGIRNSNSLPTEGNWNFYKLNESFMKIMNNDSNRLLGVMNTILKKYDITENIKARTVEEKTELIIEGNDTILERVGDTIDEINGIQKKHIEPVEIQSVTAQLPINGSWNRISKANISVTSDVNLPKGKSSPAPVVHLLAGKNIIRPQSFFKDKIDNSNNYPWQPRITEKPNSIRPLALYLEETEFGQSFCHPYETELDQFKPRPEQLLKTTPPVPKPIEETPLHEITTPEQVDELVRELRKHDVVAVDLEHHSYRTFMGITCLMQISTTEADYLIDTLILRDKLHALNEIFTKPAIVKVFHGADSDIQWLQRDLALYVVNLFDTHQAAKQLNYSALSLAYLLKRHCKLLANKQFQLADWRIRPLPQQLKNYAREDTHYLIYIYHIMKNELLSKANGKDNILKSVLRQSTLVCKKRYFKPILTEESYMDFYRKSKRLYDNRQLYALKYLYQWRDKLAREEDESTGYVLPNHMMLRIAETLPREMQGILACCNPIPPLVRANLLELHQFVLKAREQSVEKPIMMEPTRAAGSTQQFSKINVDSLLYCPHDLTQHEEFRDDLPTLLNQRESLDVVCKKRKLELEETETKHSVFYDTDDLNNDVVNGISKNWKILTPFQRYILVKSYIVSEEAKKIENKEIKQETS